MQSIRILVGADIVPTHSNERLFRKGDIDTLLGSKLAKIYKAADFRILNLEVPLTDSISPIKKTGPNLIAPTNTIQGLKAINPDCFGLANNHILDQGEKGLMSTIDLLKNNEIGYVGAGKNIEEAKEAYIKEVKGIKVGIYACAEHEFSIAGNSNAGANPYDPLESFDNIRDLCEKTDICIVLYHGGKEFYRYPTPVIQKVFRKFAECGADLVIAQHTHCIGAMEKYMGSTLVYGQGNFLFDGGIEVSNPYFDFWKTSLIVCIDTDGSNNNISFLPIISLGASIMLADGGQGNEILNGFVSRSIEIESSKNIEMKYKELAIQMKHQYLYGVSGGYAKLFPVRILNKISRRRFMEVQYKEENSLELQNFLQCETHRELLAQILQLYQTEI